MLKRVATDIGLREKLKGIKVKGIPIGTMTEDVIRMFLPYADDRMWKSGDKFYKLTPQDCKEIAIEMGRHIEKTHAIEKEVWDGIEAGTITSVRQIEEVFNENRSSNEAPADEGNSGTKKEKGTDGEG
jgi:hypothetical protein